MKQRFVLVLSVVVALAVAPVAWAKPVKLRTGLIELAFDNTFGLSLVQLGVTPRVIAPAEMDGVTFTLPVAGGSAGARKTTVNTRGGFDLDDAADGVSLKLSDITAVVRGKRVSLRGFAVLNGIETDKFEFATGRAKRATRTGSGLIATGIPLRLTEIGSTAMNSQFGSAQFETGAVIGSARIDAFR